MGGMTQSQEAEPKPEKDVQDGELTWRDISTPRQGEEDIHVHWRGAGRLVGGSEWGLRAQQWRLVGGTRQR